MDKLLSRLGNKGRRANGLSAVVDAAVGKRVLENFPHIISDEEELRKYSAIARTIYRECPALRLAVPVSEPAYGLFLSILPTNLLLNPQFASTGFLLDERASKAARFIAKVVGVEAIETSRPTKDDSVEEAVSKVREEVLLLEKEIASPAPTSPTPTSTSPTPTSTDPAPADPAAPAPATPTPTAPAPATPTPTAPAPATPTPTSPTPATPTPTSPTPTSTSPPPTSTSPPPTSTDPAAPPPTSTDPAAPAPATPTPSSTSTSPPPTPPSTKPLKDSLDALMDALERSRERKVEDEGVGSFAKAYRTIDGETLLSIAVLAENREGFRSLVREYPSLVGLFDEDGKSLLQHVQSLPSGRGFVRDFVTAIEGKLFAAGEPKDALSRLFMHDIFQNGGEGLKVLARESYDCRAVLSGLTCEIMSAFLPSIGNHEDRSELVKSVVSGKYADSL